MEAKPTLLLLLLLVLLLVLLLCNLIALLPTAQTQLPSDEGRSPRQHDALLRENVLLLAGVDDVLLAQALEGKGMRRVTLQLTL